MISSPAGSTATKTDSQSYVRQLERRVKDLEQRLASALTPQTSQNEPSTYAWNEDTEAHLSDLGTAFLHSDSVNHTPPLPSDANQVPSFDPSAVSPTNARVSAPRTDSFAEELRLLSLEAAAERYLGSSSGLSLAKLTQTVLQRLSPDQDGFMFDGECDENQHNHESEPDTSSNLNMKYFEMLPSLTSPLPLDFLLGNTAEDFEDSMALALLEPSHISYILEFYFAHSHTLYPMIRKSDFEAVLWGILADPLDPLAQSPLWQYRIWMVLAIGSTTYCSVSLMDETESVQFFNKAMTYFESAMGCGDLVRVHACKSVKGFGTNASQPGRSGSVNAADWTNVVSLALGRPFAIQDDDITVEPFSEVDDESIKPDGINSTTNLEPSTMAVPLHILALRRIASDIGTQVHSPKFSRQQSPEAREETLQSLHKRLLDWRRSMPFPLPDLQSKVPHLCTSWFDLNYYTHVIMLYRPSPLSPSLDSAKMKILAEASSMAIRQATNMYRQRRFAYNWLNLVAIFNSALSLMYTSTAQADHISLVLDHARVIDDLELAVELLEAFSTKFSSARKIQGMIRVVSAKLEVYRVPSV
ncbi:uncharacterized protein N7484_002903 [Penicillium longicatenatum]|uniref:uncharacterized protein n=1 Tax=Penicillium longicatenatum TaxID=1561947 RepID=UPI0025492ACE|nr:uncharacterized protein N7484_002903 [Penicillium longicatenatum]KAJ5649180.1 hypothetical protein N7484_002903 [Penicillium longicatenatum]